MCRRRYYEEGWLATGNGRGVVGVTFTSSHCRRDRNTPQRINFNLRGHNSEVSKSCVMIQRLSDAGFGNGSINSFVVFLLVMWWESMEEARD